MQKEIYWKRNYEEENQWKNKTLSSAFRIIVNFIDSGEDSEKIELVIEKNNHIKGRIMQEGKDSKYESEPIVEENKGEDDII